jgi:hypothetical protein
LTKETNFVTKETKVTKITAFLEHFDVSNVLFVPMMILK